MKYLKCFLFLCNILVLQLSFAQNAKVEQINSGFVFINGEYIEPPYLIKSSEDQLFINEIVFYGDFQGVNLHNKQVDISPEITKNSPSSIISNSLVPNASISYAKSACNYYIYKYDSKSANDSIIEYYKRLPNVKSIIKNKGVFYNVTFFNGEEKLMIFSPDHLERIKTNITKQEQFDSGINEIKTKLNEDKAVFIFTDNESFTYRIKSHEFIDSLGVELVEINPEGKKQIISSIFQEDGVSKGQNKIEESVDFEKSMTVGEDQIFEQVFFKKMRTATSAYSPTRNKIIAFCPAVFESDVFGAFDSEFNNVKEEIQSSGYVEFARYKDLTANDNSFACDYGFLTNLAENAGFLYIATHGGTESGLLLARGTSHAELQQWCGSDVNVTIAQESEATKPDDWSNNIDCWSAYASSDWVLEHWAEDLIANKTITIISACHSYSCGWVDACAGGVCFGYDDVTNFTTADNTNKKILKLMNGKSDEGESRMASLAYNSFIQENPTSHLKLAANEEITLCPGISSKFPLSDTDVGAEGEGYILFDTWCNSNIPLYVDDPNSPVSFLYSNLVNVYDLAWDYDYSGKSNKITFKWQSFATEQEAINIYLKKESITSVPAYFDEGHNLDLPNDDYVYSFTVNPLFGEFYEISGTVYKEGYIPLAGAQVSCNESTAVSDAEGKFTLYVPFNWYGDIYVNASGYQSQIYEIIDPIENNLTVDIVMHEVEGISISYESTQWAVYNFSIENKPINYDIRWDFGDPYTEDDWNENPTPTYTYTFAGTYEVVLTLTSVLTGEELDPIITSITVPSQLDNIYCPDFTSDCQLVQIGTEVTFYNTSSYGSTGCVLWKWVFEHGTDNETNSDLFYMGEGVPLDPNDLAISHTFNYPGHKIIKLQFYRQSGIFNYDETYTPPGGSLTRFVASQADWGGVNVLDCSNVCEFIPALNKFAGAIRSTWALNNWNGPLFIYGGNFIINGESTQYLSENNTVVSACNQIEINGENEFVANGDTKLILETNENPCLQQSNKNLKLKDESNDYSLQNEFYCYPNPVHNDLNLSFNIEIAETLRIQLFSLEGKLLLDLGDQKFEKGTYSIIIDIEALVPNVYVLRVGSKSFKIVKQ